MKKTFKMSSVWFLGICFFFLAVNAGTASEYDSLQGLKSFKAVVDVRSGKPASLAMQLGLVHAMFKDASVRSVTDSPEFVLIFMGPAVKLVTAKTEGLPAEDREAVAQIAKTISAMAKDGIRLEICLFAADALGVDRATILPDIKHVGNGWISLVGYQHMGYGLVPIY